jgi:hypothetical protein
VYNLTDKRRAERIGADCVCAQRKVGRFLNKERGKDERVGKREREKRGQGGQGERRAERGRER